MVGIKTPTNNTLNKTTHVNKINSIASYQALWWNVICISLFSVMLRIHYFNISTISTSNCGPCREQHLLDDPLSLCKGDVRLVPIVIILLFCSDWPKKYGRHFLDRPLPQVSFVKHLHWYNPSSRARLSQ